MNDYIVTVQGVFNADTPEEAAELFEEWFHSGVVVQVIDTDYPLEIEEVSLR